MIICLSVTAFSISIFFLILFAITNIVATTADAAVEIFLRCATISTVLICYLSRDRLPWISLLQIAWHEGFVFFVFFMLTAPP